MITVHCAWCNKRHDWFAMPLVYDGLTPGLEPYGCEMRNNEHGGSICIPAGIAFAARAVAAAVPSRVRINALEA